MLVTMRRLLDAEEVKRLVHKDVLYKTMLEIGTLEGYVPDLHVSAWFLVSRDGIEVGIMIAKPFGTNCINFHGGVFKEFRGQETPELVRECLEILRKQFNGVFMTTVNEHNTASIKLVKKLGMIEKTRIVNGYKTGDLIIFGEE